jgi:hypothetical protein
MQDELFRLVAALRASVGDMAIAINPHCGKLVDKFATKSLAHLASMKTEAPVVNVRNDH